jgi:hypothetical protein
MEPTILDDTNRRCHRWISRFDADIWSAAGLVCVLCVGGFRESSNSDGRRIPVSHGGDGQKTYLDQLVTKLT